MIAKNGWRITSLDERIAQHSEAESGCPVTYTYSANSARRLLKGFRIMEVCVEHIFPYRVEDYVRYRYVKEWYFRFLPRPLFRALERTIGWHLLIRATPV